MNGKTDLKIFCIEPTLKNFKFLSQDIQEFFYKKSKKCLEKNIGNKKLAKKVELLYTVKNLSSKKILCLKAIFSGMSLLTTEQFKKNYEKWLPKIINTL